MYYTLLMSTGLTFGTISALFGLNHGVITTRPSTRYLVAAVIGSAVIPTLVANAFFMPRHLLGPSASARDCGEPQARGTRNVALVRRRLSMFRKILVAYDGSEGAKAALRVGIGLAKSLGVELHSISVEEHLPHYAATIGEVQDAKERIDLYFRTLTKEARDQALLGESISRPSSARATRWR